MNMRVPIVLVVGTKDCLQTNYGDVVHCCTKFHVCQLFISTWILYSTLALSHFPFFFDVVCTQVHCLPINDNYENNVFKKNCQNIAVDVIRLYPCIKCGEC